MEQNIYNYIISEITNYRTVKVPITESVDWNMYQHIERCTNVANGWYHTGDNDGNRPYRDIVTPIKHVAIRSEGFDVKDIVPFVDDAKQNWKSFLIKKYHPIWARKNRLDNLIDEAVECSVIYDLVLFKKVKNVSPEIVPLQQIAFCDQTDILSGPLCLRHQYSPTQLLQFKGIWNDEEIDRIILLAQSEKSAPQGGDKKIKTPGKYIELFELRGYLPDWWLSGTDTDKGYSHQMHIIGFYSDEKGDKQGITLFKGKDKPLTENFKALVLNPVYGRACGKSITESLFEPQVWVNYSEQKIKKLLDSAISVYITDSDELAGQKLTDLKLNTILKQEKGSSTNKIDSTLQNLTQFQNYQISNENNARIIGSASDAQLGTNPVSGTPFALQNLVVQQGQGIHEYRQGKIASFFADELYQDWILDYLVQEMEGGKKFSEVLSISEMEEIANQIAENQANKKILEAIFDRKEVRIGDREQLIQFYKESLFKAGNRKFIEILGKELKNIPISVSANIKGKQRYMSQNADKLTNIIREIIKNPQAFSQASGLSEVTNQLLEESGLSPINFAGVFNQKPIIKETQNA